MTATTVLSTVPALRWFLNAKGPFSLAVWDFDGVVADTEPAQAHAYREMLTDRGIQTQDDFFNGLAGRSEREIWTELQRRYGFAGDIARLRDERVARVTPILIKRLRPNWFVEPALAVLRGSNTRSIVLSSGNEQIVHYCLRSWHLDGLFDAVYASSGDLQEPPKSERLRATIEGVYSLVIEDSLAFLKLASDLGATTLAVQHSLNSCSEGRADAFLSCGTAPPTSENLE